MYIAGRQAATETTTDPRRGYQRKEILTAQDNQPNLLGCITEKGQANPEAVNEDIVW